MSMRSWTEDGYGYELYNGKNFDKVKEFIVQNSEFTYEDIEEAENDYEIEDIIDCPVPWKVADIINELEGFNLFKGYRDDGDTGQKAMIGIEPKYPWMYKKPITREEADGILAKYAEMLGITDKPDYFEAQYFG